MTTEDQKKPHRKSGSFQAIFGVFLSAILLGALIFGYFTWRGDGAFPGWGSDAESAPLLENEKDAENEGDAASDSIAGEAAQTVLPRPQSLVEEGPETEKATEAVERVEEQQGGLDQRLAAAEQRLNRLDLQAQAAVGNVARAEGLLIAFAARRSLERGAKLGYLTDQLRLRFSDALPNAVETVIAMSRDPVTLDQLIARLDGLTPELKRKDEGATLDSVLKTINDLFAIRRESTPSSQPERRLERARLFLESGRVSSAIEEVENLPGAQQASQWIVDAKRYADAQRALDLIETSAVLEPRRLRDREGQPIEQPSPVE